MGSTLDLCRRDNTEHWPHVASLTGEHHPCATPNSTACYISPTSTPSAYCQPGFLPAIFRSANTNVHSRAAQLNTETYLQSPPLVPASAVRSNAARPHLHAEPRAAKGSVATFAWSRKVFSFSCPRSYQRRL